MKISELIEELTIRLEEFGDMELRVWDDRSNSFVSIPGVGGKAWGCVSGKMNGFLEIEGEWK